MAKVYSTILRYRLYTFLTENNYIEHNIQKGFWEGISGTIEHTQLLTYLINHAKIKQRHLIVTLIDLKNAFGEVDHNLLFNT